MRNREIQARLRRAKQRSYTKDTTLVVIKGGDREFFRYSDGSLTEYQMTSSKGREIRLTQEEDQVANGFVG